MSLTNTQRIYEHHGVTGRATLVAGSKNRAVLKFRWEHPTGRRDGTNLVLTVVDGQIAEMIEHRWTWRARRIADVAA